MTKEDVEKIKQVSRGKNGPWSGPFAYEMWKKSAIRRLSKRLPMSTDLEHTIKADDNLYDLDGNEGSENAPEKTKGPSNLKAAMASQEGSDEPALEVEAELIDEEEVPI